MILPIHEPVRWFSPDIKITFSTGTNTWTVSDIFGNAPDADWQVDANAPTIFTANHFQTIDLSGLQENYLTFNPLSYFVQRFSPPESTVVGAGPTNSPGATAIQHWVTSTKPIPPGFNTDNITYSETYGPSYDELVGMNYQVWVNDTTGASALMALRDSQTLGALQATAAAKLYTLTRVTFIIQESPVNLSTIGFASGVVTMAQEVVKEKDLEYIMRVKRAYDS